MMTTKRITLIAVLAAIGVIGRIYMQFIPSVQPVTAIIIISSYYLGAGSAMLLAILTTYLSNMVLGMGFWTIWQIVAWVSIAGFASLFGKLSVRRAFPILLCLGIGAGFFYGFIFSLLNYVVSGKFIAYYLAGLPFDVNHAIGNAIFIFLLYKPLSYIFKKNL